MPADNSMFAVRFAHPSAFGSPQTRQPLIIKIQGKIL